LAAMNAVDHLLAADRVLHVPDRFRQYGGQVLCADDDLVVLCLEVARRFARADDLAILVAMTHCERVNDFRGSHVADDPQGRAPNRAPR
jgi:hypothetical protein